MSYFMAGERRLLPDKLSVYLKIVEQIYRSKVSTGAYWMRVYVSESDPNHVLFIGHFPNSVDFAAIERSVESEFGTLITSLRAIPSAPLIRYDPLQTFERVNLRPTELSANLYRVKPESVKSVTEWGKERIDKISVVSGLAAARLLTARDAPGRMMGLVEYSGTSARKTVAEIARTVERPVPAEDELRFHGHVGYDWDRPD